MEKKDLAEVVKKFDHFVHFSLTHKEEDVPSQPVRENKVELYLNSMEKRLKLKPQSQEQRFQNLLKPMKGLKSFVSVREFMETLGTCTVGKITDRTEREEKNLKLQYQNIRGGYYLEKIEEHLKSKNFKRSTRNNPYFVTEPENNSLQNSEYRTWVQNALNKISLKSDNFFKKGEKIKSSRHDLDRSRCKLGQSIVLFEDEKDCLIEQHQREYVDNAKVDTHVRLLATQEYQNFAKISTLLTGRLRKILKTNSNPRNSALSAKNNAFLDQSIRRDKPNFKNSLKLIKQNKQNSSRRVVIKNGRVHTAGVQRRDDSEVWREGINNKLKNIINDSLQQ